MEPPEELHSDHYAVLGLPRDADDSAIRQAWRQLAARHHPDVCSGDPASLDAFLRIQDAYRVLIDPGHRSRYDAALQDACSLRESAQDAPAPENCLPLSDPTGLGIVHAGSRFADGAVVFLRRAAGTLPVQFLLHPRTLAAALLVGVLTVAWQLPSARQPPGGAGSSQGPLHSRTAPPLAQPAEDPLAPPPSLTRAGNRAGTAPMRVLGRSPDPTETLGRTASAPAAGPSQGIVTLPAEVPAFSGQDPGAEAPAAPSAVHAEPDAVVPTAAMPPSPALPGDWNGRWLAGCTNPEGSQVWVGLVELREGAGRLAWRPWDAVPGTAPQTVAIQLSHPEIAAPTPVAAPGLPDAVPIPAALRWIPHGFAQLSLTLPPQRALPCAQWNLAALPGPAASGAASPSPAAPLAGRWLRPDGTSPAGAMPFVLDTVELRIEECPARFEGRLISQYRIQDPAGPTPAGPNPLARLASRSPTLLQAHFTMPAENFSGEFRWRSDDYGEGTLTVAPISASTIAVRWHATKLPPGSIRIASLVAVLRRR